MTRLQTYRLYDEAITSYDQLKNPVTTQVLKKETKGRMTNWTVEEIQLLPRTVTTTQEKVLVTADLDECLGSKKLVSASGQSYDIVEITEYTPRWTLIRVKAYGV